jgi:HEAT repeat protein
MMLCPYLAWRLEKLGRSQMHDENNLDLDARILEARNNPATTDELISLALSETDEDLAWEAVVTLHLRGTREVLDAARKLCASNYPKERKLGADILGQLGVPVRSFPVESVKALLPMLKTEQDDEAIYSICIALGHIHDPATVPVLAKLKSHPSVQIRWAIAGALGGFEDQLAITTLIELSRDQDGIVRDWATFGLGTQISVNTPEIKNALLARLSDKDEVTRGEALRGLATRKDQRVLKPLIKELERYHQAEYGIYALEAAEKFADERLIPVLTRLKKDSKGESSQIDEIIRCCSGKQPKRFEGDS